MTQGRPKSEGVIDHHFLMAVIADFTVDVQKPELKSNDRDSQCRLSDHPKPQAY